MRVMKADAGESRSGQVSRSRGVMFEETARRLAAVVLAPHFVSGGPPPKPTAWERALARRDRIVSPETREQLELARIDRCW